MVKSQDKISKVVIFADRSIKYPMTHVRPNVTRRVNAISKSWEIVRSLAVDWT